MFKLRQEHATKRNAFCQQACIFSEQHFAKKNISGSDIYSGFVDLPTGPVHLMSLRLTDMNRSQ